MKEGRTVAEPRKGTGDMYLSCSAGCPMPDGAKFAESGQEHMKFLVLYYSVFCRDSSYRDLFPNPKRVCVMVFLVQSLFDWKSVGDIHKPSPGVC